MTKRKTKAQREQEQKDALLRRIVDIYSGAEGSKIEDDEMVLPGTLSKVIPVVRVLFGEPRKDWFGWRAHCLDSWETPAMACELLYEHGFRADKVWTEVKDD